MLCVLLFLPLSRVFLLHHRPICYGRMPETRRSGPCISLLVNLCMSHSKCRRLYFTSGQLLRSVLIHQFSFLCFFITNLRNLYSSLHPNLESEPKSGPELKSRSTTPSQEILRRSTWIPLHPHHSRTTVSGQSQQVRANAHMLNVSKIHAFLSWLKCMWSMRDDGGAAAADAMMMEFHFCVWNLCILC